MTNLKMDYEKFDKGVNFLDTKLVKCPCPTFSEYVHKLYALHNQSIRQIAKEFDATNSCIRYHLIKMGVARRPKGGRNYWKVTEEMKREIRTVRRTDMHYAEKFGLHPTTVFKIRKALV